MKVGDLLRAALALLDEPVEELAGSWPRGAAVLARQAIEATVAHWWAHAVPQMAEANWTEQWLALPSYLGRSPLVPEAHYAWTALSEACHHRSYEIGLTEPELRAHLRTAHDFAKLVARAVRDRADEVAAAP